MSVPVTSASLLRVLGTDATSPRWTEFARLYASMIDGFLFRYFPSVDADEVVNEVLIALVDKLPVYRYDPDANGHFRNYLIGIVRYKAIEQMKKRKREADHRDEYETQAKLEWEYESRPYSADLTDWQREAYETALTQFLADPKISPRDKEIFSRVALKGESAEKVAEIFQMKRNSVDQVKSRMVAKLRELALAYARVLEK